MCNSQFVQILNCLGNLIEDSCGLFFLHRTMDFEVFKEFFALNEFHKYINPVLCPNGLINSDYVWVPQFFVNADLSLQIDQILFGESLKVDNFHSNFSSCMNLNSFVDCCESTFSNFFI